MSGDPGAYLTQLIERFLRQHNVRPAALWLDPSGQGRQFLPALQAGGDKEILKGRPGVAAARDSLAPAGAVDRRHGGLAGLSRSEAKAFGEQ